MGWEVIGNIRGPEGPPGSGSDLPISAGDGQNSIVEGTGSSAVGDNAHAEGVSTAASGAQAHSEGLGTNALNVSSHAEGEGTSATGPRAHAEGNGTAATDDASHAEGTGTMASGQSAHAEGTGTTAQGSSSHAEGVNSTASGHISRATGDGSVASGDHASAEMGANAWRHGERGYGGNGMYFNPQVSEFIGGNGSITGTDTMFFQGATDRLLLTDNKVSLITGTVLATTNALTAAWTIGVAIRMVSGVATLVGTPTVTLISRDSGASAWTVTPGVTVADQNWTAGFHLTCSASGPTAWVARLTVLERDF